MNTSFYTAALGAGSQQERLNVISNNMANLNTTGYRGKNATFLELMQYNLNDPEDTVTELQTGAGGRVEKTDTNFAGAAVIETGNVNDFAIMGDDGFFMLQNPITQEITYTRDGSFALSNRGGTFYLVSGNGKLVLDQNRQPIRMSTNGVDINGNVPNIGVFGFAQKNGMESVGDNEFAPIEKNGQPVLLNNVKPVQMSLERSNVELSLEMTRMIQTQRAYSLALRMVMTSDEIESTINGLRQ